MEDDDEDFEFHYNDYYSESDEQPIHQVNPNQAQEDAGHRETDF